MHTECTETKVITEKTGDLRVFGAFGALYLGDPKRWAHSLAK